MMPSGLVRRAREAAQLANGKIAFTRGKGHPMAMAVFAENILARSDAGFETSTVVVASVQVFVWGKVTLASRANEGCFVLKQDSCVAFTGLCRNQLEVAKFTFGARFRFSRWRRAEDGFQRGRSFGGSRQPWGACGESLWADANACLMLLKFEFRNRCTSFFEHFFSPTRCLIRLLNLTLRTTGCSGSTSHGCKYSIAGDPDCLISFIALIVRLSGNKRK